MTATQDLTSAVFWFAGWITFIVLLQILVAIPWGRVVVYYTLWLMVILLLITSGPEIQKLLSYTGFQTPLGTTSNINEVPVVPTISPNT